MTDFWIRVDDLSDGGEIFHVHAMDITKTMENEEGLWLYNAASVGYRVYLTGPDVPPTVRMAQMLKAFNSLRIG